MAEDTKNISNKTWARNMEPLVKMGYMDGAFDGQTTVFQDSFNVGYEQGLSFGLELGCREAIARMQQQSTDLPEPQDPHRINCHYCTNVVKAQENISNLYNIQKQKNAEYLSTNK